MFSKDAPASQVPPLGSAVFTDPSIPSRACCCPARPVVRITMPPAPGRAEPVDLWLCGHHYRASIAALCAAGAVVEDLTGPAGPAEAYYAAAVPAAAAA